MEGVRGGSSWRAPLTDLPQGASGAGSKGRVRVGGKEDNKLEAIESHPVRNPGADDADAGVCDADEYGDVAPTPQSAARGMLNKL